ncbi:hypothetical protein BDR26DRAFT_1005563 [Obelidium mucronatum]|nr:hypothetical protein BDR26DRAFT_1005563 [Obelidium mucronatum]
MPIQVDPLTYHGGRILANTEVFAVFYPSTYGPVPFMNETIDFYSSITNSQWWDVMNQYSTPTQKWGPGKFVGSYVETGPTKNYLNDVPDVQPYLRNLVKSGVIKPSKNTYVAMHYGPYIQIVAGGLGSCGYWCGYHWSVDISDLVPGLTTLAYGGIPDFFVGGGCDRCVGSNQLGKTLITAAHELAEAALDPDYGKGWSEVADTCNLDKKIVTANNGHSFEIQSLWSNADMACRFEPSGVTPPSTTKTATTTTTTTTYKTTTTIALTANGTSATTTSKVATTNATSTKTSTTTTTTTTAKSTTTTKPTTTTKASGAISNGLACSVFGSRGCNSACICGYTSSNTLAWQCNPASVSC